MLLNFLWIQFKLNFCLYLVYNKNQLSFETKSFRSETLSVDSCDSFVSDISDSLLNKY